MAMKAKKKFSNEGWEKQRQKNNQQLRLEKRNQQSRLESEIEPAMKANRMLPKFPRNRSLWLWYHEEKLSWNFIIFSQNEFTDYITLNTHCLYTKKETSITNFVDIRIRLLTLILSLNPWFTQDFPQAVWIGVKNLISICRKEFKIKKLERNDHAYEG